jgi:hypothetical protein
MKVAPRRGAGGLFATLEMRMGATHFLMKRLPNVATEMALNALSYNLTRVLNIVGVGSHAGGDTDGRPRCTEVQGLRLAGFRVM